MYLSVLGMLHIQNTTRPIKAHATVQTLLSVRVFRQIVHVWIWLPITKTWNRT